MIEPLASPPELPALYHELETRAEIRKSPIPGGEMVWRVWGKGPPMLLVHGMHGSWTHWIRNIEPLSRRFRLYVPDLPGFGDSAIGEIESIDELSAALAGGTDIVGLSGDYHIAAFSFGSTITFHMPVDQRERVRRIVLLGSAGLGPFKRVSGELSPWRHIEDPLQRAQTHADNLAIMMVSDPATIDAGTVAIQMRNTERMTLRRRKIVTTAQTMKRFASWKPPHVDFVWGSEDLIIRESLEETKVNILGVVPHARLHVLDGVGHWVQHEGADEVNAILSAL